MSDSQNVPPRSILGLELHMKNSICYGYNFIAAFGLCPMVSTYFLSFILSLRCIVGKKYKTYTRLCVVILVRIRMR